MKTRDKYYKIEKVINEKQKAIIEDRKKYAKDFEDLLYKQLERLNKKFKNLNRWGIQPIKTLQGGPFMDVNDVVRQLYKEGFRNIMLVSCNPGGHTLDKDLKDKSDLKVHYAQASLLSETAAIIESVTLTDSYMLVESTLDSITADLMSVCESHNFYYNTIIESTENFLDCDHINLNEGTIHDIWVKLKEFISRILKGIVGLFAKVVNWIKELLTKIKDFFKKIFSNNSIDKSFSGKIKTSYIMVENANMKQLSIDSWKQYEDATLRACESISRKIQEMERKNVSNLEELERYADKQAKSINESIDTDYEKLLSLII